MDIQKQRNFHKRWIQWFVELIGSFSVIIHLEVSPLVSLLLSYLPLIFLFFFHWYSFPVIIDLFCTCHGIPFGPLKLSCLPLVFLLCCYHWFMLHFSWYSIGSFMLHQLYIIRSLLLSYLLCFSLLFNWFLHAALMQWYSIVSIAVIIYSMQLDSNKKKF